MNDAANCTHRQFTESQSYCPDCGLSRSEALVAACEPYLKDAETPAECIARNRRDVDGCLTMLIQERKKVEALAARLAEAEAERDTWQACALMAGEYCGETVGPTGYYEFTPMQFKLWFRGTVAYKRPSRLAEAEALLREVAHDGQDIGGNIELFDRIDAFLAAGVSPPASTGPVETT